jgi:hypothetical protein
VLAWNSIEFGSTVLNGIGIGPTFTYPREFVFIGDVRCWPFAVFCVVRVLALVRPA